MATNDKEKNLFDALPSMSGADPQPTKREREAAAGQAEEFKKTEPRADKPQAYYLYQDDELKGGELTAAGAFEALKKDPLGTRIEAADGEKANKVLVKKEQENQYWLAQEMKDDLQSEGFKIGQAEQGIIEKALELKNAAPRADKPVHYDLYDGDSLYERADGNYSTAAAAFEELKTAPVGVSVKAIYLDGTIEEMATKETKNIEFKNFTPGPNSTYEGAAYRVTDDMKNNLKSEGFTTDQVEQGIIEKDNGPQAERNLPHQEPQARQPVIETTRNTSIEKDADPFKELAALSKQFSELRSAMPEAEWQHRMTDVLKTMPVPSEQKDQKQSDFNIWLMDNRQREPQAAPEEEASKQHHQPPSQEHPQQEPDIDIG